MRTLPRVPEGTTQAVALWSVVRYCWSTRAGDQRGSASRWQHHMAARSMPGRGRTCVIPACPWAVHLPRQHPRPWRSPCLQSHLCCTAASGSPACHPHNRLPLFLIHMAACPASPWPAAHVSRASRLLLCRSCLLMLRRDAMGLRAVVPALAGVYCMPCGLGSDAVSGPWACTCGVHECSTTFFSSPTPPPIACQAAAADTCLVPWT